MPDSPESNPGCIPRAIVRTLRAHAGEVVDLLLRHRLLSSPKLVKCTDGASKNFDHQVGSRRGRLPAVLHSLFHNPRGAGERGSNPGAAEDFATPARATCRGRPRIRGSGRAATLPFWKPVPLASMPALLACSVHSDSPALEAPRSEAQRSTPYNPKHPRMTLSPEEHLPASRGAVRTRREQSMRTRVTIRSCAKLGPTGNDASWCDHW
jgi:hypothetical protein